MPIRLPKVIHLIAAFDENSRFVRLAGFLFSRV